MYVSVCNEIQIAKGQLVGVKKKEGKITKNLGNARWLLVSYILVFSDIDNKHNNEHFSFKLTYLRGFRIANLCKH